ncbi:MAG: TrmH family RNA methyltransferase [Acidimicrobiales bacterium]
MQRLRRLASRRAARVAERAYIVEGPTLVIDALDAGVALEAAYVEPGAPAAAAAAAERLDRAGVPVYEVADGVLAKAGATVTPQGILAVAPVVDATIDRLLEAPMIVVLVDVGDPGNAGTLVRTAEAAGAGGIVFAGASVDPFSPKTVRASAGSIFRVPIAVASDVGPVLDRVGGAGHRRIGTSVGEGKPWYDADLAAALAVVLGNEAHGLPGPAADRVDAWVHIPMAGRVESLNVAVAGALVLFEAARQRGESIGPAPNDTAGFDANG